jgi:hypothetical protein
MRKLLLLSVLLLLAVAGWTKTCTITSDASPPAVNAGATHAFTASCPTPVWSVSGPGSINSSTGVYKAPSTVWAQDVARGRQLLPNDSVYKLPINSLPVDPRSSYWIQRVADQAACPGSGCIPSYHNFKLLQPGKLSFYDNVVNNSTPTQLMHSYYPNPPWQDTAFPTLLPPNNSQQGGWSMDDMAALDRHVFSINSQTGDEFEIYLPGIDFKTAVMTPGNPTLIAYTTHSIRTVQNPLRIYITGITGGCSILNNSNPGYLATVVSQTPGTGGTLSVAVNTIGLTCTRGAPKVASVHPSLTCPTCNALGQMRWSNSSNAISGGVDAGGSPLSASSIHTEEWWNVVQQNILDPACNCITLGHALRTTLTNGAISPRAVWPSVSGMYVTGGHTPDKLLSVVTGMTTTFSVSPSNWPGSISKMQSELPCAGYTYTVGCTFHIVIGGPIGAYKGTWAPANGSWLATAVRNNSFSIPLNSTGFPALPAGGYFIDDWLPYGSHIRLKSSFNVAGFCSPTALTAKCPYEKAILNTLQVYGLVLLDGTLPGSNWESGIVSSEFDPDQLTNAAVDLKNNTALHNIEQYLEVADASGQQLNFQPFTDPTNRIGLTAHNRVTVTVSSPGYKAASIDVQLQGTAVGTDRERISIVTGSTYQINSWVSGNAVTTMTYAMSPPVSGASVSSTGLITAPHSLSAIAKTTVTITSTAEATANAYVDVFFVPVSPDGKIRLALGQHATSYTDTLGNKWWGQNVPRGWQDQYESADGLGFQYLLGTWQTNCNNWIPGCGNSTDAQLYAQSIDARNDTNLTIALPNGNYSLTLYGEPGYGTTRAGQNVYDVEIQGTVVSSYNDGFLLAGSHLYHGYTTSYSATVSNGLLQFNGRIRESSNYGMSVSSLLISPGVSGAHHPIPGR